MGRMLRNGRNRGGGQFVRLDHDLIMSPAWEGLSTQARAVLIQVAKRYNGRNNGTLGASVRDMATECRINKNTASKALGELIDAGFLELAQAGSFSFKKRHAAEYRLTWEKCDMTGHRGTRAWKAKNSGQKELKDFHGLNSRLHALGVGD